MRTSSPSEPTFIERALKAHQVFRIKAGETNKFVLLANPQQESVPFVQVIEIFDVGGSTPPNVHRAATELFVVLAGTGLAQTDAGEVLLQPGSTLLMYPGCTHAVRNTGPGRLYCLTTMAPDEGFSKLICDGVADALDAQDLQVLGWA